jgi:hypothetical protein
MWIAAGEDAMTRPTPSLDARHTAACRASVRAVARRGVFRPMQDHEPFFPRGAIAFFAAMMAFYAAFWFLIAAIMVRRG